MNDNNVSILDGSTFLVSRPMEISTPDLIKHMACSERYASLVEMEAHQPRYPMGSAIH